MLAHRRAVATLEDRIPEGANSLAGDHKRLLEPPCSWGAFFSRCLSLVCRWPACWAAGPKKAWWLPARLDAVEVAVEWLANSQTIRIAAWTARTASDQPT